MTDRTAWADQAACAGMIALFDAACDNSHGGHTGAQQSAINVCFACPVREECLTFALENDTALPYGIFGGLTPTERLRLRRNPPDIAACGHRFDPKNQRACSACLHLARLARDAKILAKAAAGKNRQQISVETGVAHRTISDVLARYADTG